MGKNKESNKMSEGGELVGEGSKIEPVLKDIFDLMDDNHDKIDQDEGIAIGVAMGETEEQAKKSWAAMCKDMDDDENATIELPEWIDFYQKSLKDAPLDDVLQMLNAMKSQIGRTRRPT